MTRPPSLAERLRALRSDEGALAATLAELAEVFERRESEVRAFVAEPDRFDRLRREAAVLRQRHPVPEERPPLFGLPVAVKDVFHVDGFPTCAGCGVPPEELSGPEAAAVTRLKRAGALFLGKTATTEFAYFAPGPTRNPRDLERTPGGSSSGSAAAVAAGMAPLALGTQTIGSISRPASFCGVVGYKPTYDRISRSGLVPLSPSLDHVGFFTEHVPGAELIAAVLCEDWRALEPGGGKPRLAIPDGPLLAQAEAAGRKRFDDTRRRLAESFEVTSVPVMADFEEIRRRHDTIVAAEAARVHARWYGCWRASYHEKTRQLIERGRAVDDEELARALAGRGELRAALEEARRERDFDLWISPAAPGPAPRGLEWTGDPVMNLPWTHAGLPTLAVPIGSPGSAGGDPPMGLQLAAGWGRDEELLRWGSEIEGALAGESGA